MLKSIHMHHSDHRHAFYMGRILHMLPSLVSLVLLCEIASVGIAKCSTTIFITLLHNLCMCLITNFIICKRELLLYAG